MLSRRPSLARGLKNACYHTTVVIRLHEVWDELPRCQLFAAELGVLCHPWVCGSCQNPPDLRRDCGWAGAGHSSGVDSATAASPSTQPPLPRSICPRRRRASSVGVDGGQSPPPQGNISPASACPLGGPMGTTSALRSSRNLFSRELPLDLLGRLCFFII